MPDHARPEHSLASRLWRKDVALWHPSPSSFASIGGGLGWLDSIHWMQARVESLMTWAAGIAQSGDYDRMILLGMGGSSLAAAVFAELFPPAPGYLPLTVLDTTNPDEIASVASGDLRRCLFIVASKSGTTTETLDLYHFFCGQGMPSSAFVVITDAGSPLQRLGESAGHAVFINPADIGGRYAALSYFGLVPAALLGVDVDALLRRAQAFQETTRADDPGKNPALALGMSLGRAALAGRDKVILYLPSALHAFGLWIEQLLAESTGKDGKGLVPVIATADRVAAGVSAHGADRFHLRIGYGASQPDGSRDHALWVQHREDIGAEFFRWEVATAIAASYLRVNPFDQPDVERAKTSTKSFIQKQQTLPAPSYRGDHYDLYYHSPPLQLSQDLNGCRTPAGATDSAATDSEEGTPAATAGKILAHFRRSLLPGCYLGVLAYLPEDAETAALLQDLRTQAAAEWGLVSTLGMGPRYLHSTGQLHKGGPPSGRFIQLVAATHAQVAVPQRDYTFGQLYRAQADGDFAALAIRSEMRGGLMRVALKGDRLQSLAAFVAALRG